MGTGFGADEREVPLGGEGGADAGAAAGTAFGEGGADAGESPPSFPPKSRAVSGCDALMAGVAGADDVGLGAGRSCGVIGEPDGGLVDGVGVAGTVSTSGFTVGRTEFRTSFPLKSTYNKGGGGGGALGSPASTFT